LKTKTRNILKIFLLVSVLSTAVHFTDNYLYFEHYPQPDWVTPIGIPRSWLIWTVFGLAGYWLYTHQRFWLAYICLIVYATCGLSSLGHYLYGSLHQFSLKMHLLILTDGLAGSLILGFSVWSGLILKEPHAISA
jgi:hypothetical protein